MKTLKELLEERAKALKEARAIVEVAEGDGRNLSSEEKVIYDRIMTDNADLSERIDRRKELESKIRADLKADAKSLERPLVPQEPGDERTEMRNAFRRYLLSGRVIGPMAALEQQTDASGGYLSAPEDFRNELIKAIDNNVFIRNKATVLSVSGSDTLGVPSLDADPADADWTTEIAAVTEDTAMTLGNRQLQPSMLTKQIKVSLKLLETTQGGAETLVKDRLGYKFGITQEKGFLTGSGSTQPLGMFIASANGIPTSRDMSTGNTAIAITADNLINVKYNNKSGYNSEWIFHRDAMKQIAQLKDSNGQYLWRQALAANDPDTILGSPVNISEYAPNTFATGLYVGLYGDLSYYWIADSMAFGIQRLVELYAGTNQVGFIGRMDVDAAPVLGEAFTRVKLA